MPEFTTKAFGKNDIRGIYGETVTTEVFYYAGKAYAKYVALNSGKEINDVWLTLARDARLHSPDLAKAVEKGVTSVGANIVDLGMVPTPLGYFSEVVKFDIESEQISADGAMIVTASHNPSEYNGLKMTFNRKSLTESDIKEVKRMTEEEFKSVARESVRRGVVKSYDIIPDYMEVQRKNFPPLGEGIKIVVDSANATAGVVAPQLYKELGCEVVELFSEPDGNFPNHHPNPSDEKTLDDIKAKIKEEKADFGIAFDGDSDRIGVVDNTGYSIPGDQLLLIFALDILEQFKNRGEVPKVISEVKCSQVLYDTINQNGGEAIMWKTGHGFIKSKMKEENAILAGEMSGHIFFKDRYYGFDDAVYAGCRVIEIVAKKRRENPEFKVSDLIDSFPKMFTTREVRYPCPNEHKKAVLKELEEIIENDKMVFSNEISSIITIDGLRIIFDNGFALIRQSNTEPVFTLRFEATDKDSAEHYKSTMISLLDGIMERNNYSQKVVKTH